MEGGKISLGQDERASAKFLQTLKTSHSSHSIISLQVKLVIHLTVAVRAYQFARDLSLFSRFK